MPVSTSGAVADEATRGVHRAKKQDRGGQQEGDARNNVTAYLFLAPYLTIFALFMLAPAVAGIVISFTHWEIVGTPSFVGLQNYKDILSDSLFRTSVLNTLYFVVLSAVPLVVLGLALALLLNQKLPGRSLVRTIVFSPHVVMVSAVGIIWVWILDKTYGLLNYYLGQLGLPAIGWLTNTHWAMPALAITTIWWTVNTNMILYLAALQDIPKELYDAAKVDGAGEWAQFRFVTLPALKPVTAFVSAFTVIISWRVFGQAYVMTHGGPQTSTFVISQYIYQTAFQNFQMGPASAASVVLLVVTLAFAIVQLRTLRIF